MIGQTISHYRIVEKLGEGGMGVVYKAQDTTLDRFVAVKFLPQHLSAMGENKSRFLQEAKAAAALNHPNILNVYEIDEEDGTMFLVMEYLEGQTLKDYLTHLPTGPGIPYRQALEWAALIAQGLKAAHDKDIVHRDIKPHNIMLTNNSQIKIMDFGLAKLKSGAGLTKTGTSLGTLSYMSPEQVQGIPTDSRSDIWSLGVVLYEMLTGELPFKAEHDAGLLYLIANEDPPSPSVMDKKIPRQIDQLMKKIIEKRREDRFNTIDEVLQTFSEVHSAIESAGNQTKAKAIAVLPFGNISPDKESDYFSDGLTEELIANLAKLKDIRVVPRATSMHYKGSSKDLKTIARELGTRYILSGSVRKFQDNLRITVELIDVELDTQLWAETYKGKLDDVFDIQEQVSKQIVEALMVKLSPTEKVVLTKRSTLNPEAFDCNLRARNFLYQRTKKSMHFAVQLFQKAIDLDPRYADAYAGLGETYASLYQDADRKEIWLDKAVESSLKALMYDSALPEAYAALGLAYYNKRMFEDAITASQRSIELDANNFIGYWILGRIYSSTDRFKEAIVLFNKVLSLNPDFYSVYGDLQIVYGRIGEKENYQKILHAGLEAYERYLSRHPDDARGHMYFATDLAQVGRKEEAKIQAAKAIELSPDDPLMHYNAACFYSQMGEKSMAFQSLKTAIAAGYENYEWLQRDTDLDPIRSEPEYDEVMKGKKAK
ncbi:MAG: protein kinase [Ignavibacteriales bacterium]|nr:protein kinase [Ignavibacteriales bacterium]